MDERRGVARRLLSGLALSFASIGLAILLVATFLAVRARAWTWMQLGLSGIFVDATLALLLVAGRRRRVRGIALALLLLGCARALVAFVPREGRMTPGALVKTRYVEGGPRSLWFQGVPESETIRLGAYVGLSREEYPPNAPALDGIYDEIERGDLFERAESPLLDSWFFDREHFWLALPRRSGPVPLVVFVHGNGGTFEMYPELLARAAVDRGFAVAFLSHGMGLWKADREAATRIARVVQAVSREVPVSRVSLVGISAGVYAIFGAALLDPGRYGTLVSVSGVFPDLTDCRALEGVHVLVLHGTLDPRASIAGARAACDRMRRAGVDLTLHEDEGKDHLAILTARASWVPLIFDWLLAHGRP